MAGYATYLELRRCEERANKMGFRFAHSKYGSREQDVIALYPGTTNDGACLPHYARDAELFCGTLEEVKCFLRGIEFQNQYLKMLRVVTDKKVAEKEQVERSHQLMQRLKTGKDPLVVET